ncbi:ArsA-related P-loop ATPase [Micromonospora sp. BRA006-A]|nr:ArsA-related P-loop ATPase [Micromonospora sp. BRA006-A]
MVCCGAGGVGKTTTAAALALRAAERHGRRTVVLTIDPARRLAQSLGLTELDNTPAGEGHRRRGQRRRAARHDARHEAHVRRRGAPAHRPGEGRGDLREPLLPGHEFHLRRHAGYMAMEKLGQLHARGEWDLIVVDTPPSRSALDFLDAPARLSRFLDGRMLRLLLAPARSGGRSMFSLVTASFGMFSKVVQKVIGAQLLTDLSGFVAALDSMFGGFRQRAEQTYRILQARETAFLLVAAPEPDAVREAAYFAGRLRSERMPLAGLVLNRVHRPAADLSAAESLAAAERLAGLGGHEGTVEVLRAHAALAQQAVREEQVAARFTEAFPAVSAVSVTAQPADVHDVDGLRTIGEAISRS